LPPVANVQAANPKPEPVATVLTIQEPESSPMGKQATIIALLATDRGEPVADEHVTLFLGDVNQPEAKVDEAKTDAQGAVTLHTPRDLAAGAYLLTAVFAGSGGARPFVSSSAAAQLVVLPALIEIHTVPAVAGVPFSLGGLRFTSGRDGIAREYVNHPGLYPVEVLPFQTTAAGVRVDFERWGDEMFIRNRYVTIRGATQLEVGLAVSYLVHVTSVDVAGKPVNWDQVTSLALKSNNGNLYSWNKTQAEASFWLEASHTRHSANGLQATQFRYSVQSLLANGVNLATKDRQPVSTQANDTAIDSHLTALANPSGIHLTYENDADQFLAFGTQQALTGGSLASESSHVVALGSSPASGAKDLGPVPTVLTLEPLKTVALGESAAIVVRLTTQQGVAIADQLISLDVANPSTVTDWGAFTGRTDITGLATFHFSSKLDAGTYNLVPTFAGSRTLLPSRTTTQLMVEPAVFEIHTVPALPGITFSLRLEPAKSEKRASSSPARTSSDILLTSDKDGVARVRMTQNGVYHLMVVTDNLSLPDTRSTFKRWGDEVFVPEREVSIPGTTRLDAGFVVAHRVGLTFVDLSGQLVDPERVITVTMKSNLGGIFSLTKDQMIQPFWLQANGITRQSYGLQAPPIQYALLSVMVDGSNTVNAEQQRFFAHPNDTWQTRLLFYTAHITGRDALFGFPIGVGVSLQYADGSIHNLQFDPQAKITVGSLARGLYLVKVSGVSGLASLSPVALSRDQVVNLKVISSLDIVVVVLVGASLGLGLLFVGRPWLLTALLSPASLWALIQKTVREEFSG
jgi:hypothetical protein